MGTLKAPRPTPVLESGLRNYFQRTLKELGDIKEALDRVLAVAITDPNGVITYVNDRFCELYQYSREEIIGKTHRLLKSGAHSPEFYKNLWETITSGQVFSAEVKNRAKGGAEFWAYMVIVPFLDHGGKPYQYVSFRTDITAVKEAHAERVKRLQAEAAVQARDRFVSMAAHELKTPITSLQLVLDLLIRLSKRQNSLGETAQIHRLLDTAYYQTNRLTLIINDLLDLSRISAGRLKLTRETVDLGQLLNELITHSEEDLKATGSEVTLEIQEGMRGYWDRARLEQVMINLLSNAMKYGQRKPIHISLGREGHEVVLRVRDRGVGIPKEFQHKIFERFERSEDVRHYRGIGLGLWITRQIIDEHQGKITVESVPGQGSTFIVRLPMNSFEANGR